MSREMTNKEILENQHKGYSRKDFGLHGNGKPEYWHIDDILKAMELLKAENKQLKAENKELENTNEDKLVSIEWLRITIDKIKDRLESRIDFLENSIKEYKELEAENKVGKEIFLKNEKYIAKLEDENKELREFLRHEDTCRTQRVFGDSDCDCGLIKTLENGKI